jgi:hypothetical protein
MSPTSAAATTSTGSGTCATAAAGRRARRARSGSTRPATPVLMPVVGGCRIVIGSVWATHRTKSWSLRFESARNPCVRARSRRELGVGRPLVLRPSPSYRLLDNGCQARRHTPETKNRVFHRTFLDGETQTRTGDTTIFGQPCAESESAGNACNQGGLGGLARGCGKRWSPQIA